jgi:eukaryotic-like serine/threonine-protein kinase
LSAASLPGNPVTLCDAPFYAGGAWSAAHTILFSTGSGAIYSVPDTGGTPTPATTLDASRHELSHNYPWFLPDGRHFLFGATTAGSGHHTIRAASLDSPASKIVGEADSGAIFARGHLLYVRDKTLFAQPFDAGRLLTTGDPVPLAGQIVLSASFSASERGSLVYVAGGAPSYELVWFDRSGKRLSTLGEKLSEFSLESPPSLSPDGKWIAVDQIEMNNSDIWFYNASMRRS